MARPRERCEEGPAAGGGRAEEAPDGVRLRPMRRGDLDAVARIEAASFALPWSREMFRRELDEIENSHLLVAEDPGGGALLGYACWWEVVDECHITNFAVAPAARRRGVGAFLLRGLLDDARRRGALRATLEVRAGNAAGIALYEKEGFTMAAIRRGYYPDTGEDALVMWKERI